MTKSYNNNNYRNRGSTQVYRPQYLPNKKNTLTSPPTTSNITTTTPRTLQPQIYQPQAQVFYNTPQSPSNFNKTSTIIHTPRSYDNTHNNNNDDEIQIYFINHEHDCNVIDYSHHYEE